MKRRNLFLSLLLVGACTIVGVGYAAITKKLSVSGPLSGSINEANLKVNFQSTTHVVPKPINNTTQINATAAMVSDAGAHIEVSGMNDIGDKVYCYYLIKNESQATDNLDARLSTPKVTVSLDGGNASNDSNPADNVFEGQHFIVSAKYVREDERTPSAASGTVEGDGTTAVVKAPVLQTEGQSAAEGQTMWLLVEVSLKDIIIDNFDNHTISVNFTADTMAQGA